MKINLSVINSKHIIDALMQLEAGELPVGYRDSTDYDVVWKGKRYAPKQVVALALRHATGILPKPSMFRGGEDTPIFNKLRSLGFDITNKVSGKETTILDRVVSALESLGGVAKLKDIYDEYKKFSPYEKTSKTYRDGIRREIELNSPDSKAFNNEDIFRSLYGKGKGVWYLKNKFEDIEHAKNLYTQKRISSTNAWIFQGDPKKFQIDKYINSTDECYWIVNQNKKLITFGDIVYIWPSGKNAGIIAVAEIISEVNVFPYDLSEYWIKQPKNKSGEQLRVRLKILERRIDSPLTKDIIRDYLPDWSFLKSALGTNFKLTSKQAEIISSLLRAPKFDDYKEKDIQGRTDITPGQKWTLTKARSGQGIFKDNVIKNEKVCRVTGVADVNYLHASHIKPWSISDDTEKLHGCNGLLLSPHIHVLFDKGLISFSDEGKVLVSSKLDSSILNAWGIVKGSSTGSFSKMQREFMSYHRQNIFII